jgi:hypothetical protein
MREVRLPDRDHGKQFTTLVVDDVVASARPEKQPKGKPVNGDSSARPAPATEPQQSDTDAALVEVIKAAIAENGGSAISEEQASKALGKRWSDKDSAARRQAVSRAKRHLETSRRIRRSEGKIWLLES